MGSPGEESRAKITKVRVVGTSHIPEREVLEWLEVKKGAAFSGALLRRGAESILQNYRARGYYFAKVDSILRRFSGDSTEVRLEIFIQEGPLVKVGEVRIEGENDGVVQGLLRTFRTKPDRMFNEAELEEDIASVIQAYENSGYPFCRLQIQGLEFHDESPDTRRLDIALRLDEGPRVQIDEIQVGGNTATKSNVIVRETRLRHGELFDQRKVAKIRPRLTRLGYFASVQEPRVFVDENSRGGLLIEVKEGNSNRLDGVLGYNPPPPGKRGGSITGLLDLSFNNLVGTGRRLNARWERRGTATQELRLRYEEPWLLGFPVNIGLGFQQLIQDTTYIKRHWFVDASFPLTENLNAIGQFSQEQINPDSLGSALFGIPASRTLLASFGVELDTRDDAINPRTGLRYRTTFSVGRKRITAPQERLAAQGLRGRVDTKRALIDGEVVIPLGGPQVLDVGFHGAQVTSNEPFIPITEQFRFGGTRTVRGYREDELRGSRVGWANVEFRYLMGRRSRAFLFLDTGYYFRKEPPGGKVEGLKVGYGFGFRVETRLGVIGVDYGLGQGDSFSNGKVHVGLINEF